MNRELINLELDGKTIVNANSINSYIQELSYDFNTYEYLRSLYTMLLYSDIVNKDELLKTIKKKIEEFSNFVFDGDSLSFNEIKFKMGNNEVDSSVILYMSSLIDSMDIRLENGRLMSDEQILLDDYINYIRSLENITKDELNQIDRYDEIVKRYEMKKRKMDNFHKSSGIVTAVVIVEILLIATLLYLLA